MEVESCSVSQMNDTVVLSGFPKHDSQINLDDLACYINKLFGAEEIGTFRVRDLSDSNRMSKRQIAVDFHSGCDAMSAQKLLDGKLYTMPDGLISVLRARVTHDPKLLAEQFLFHSKILNPTINEPSSSVDDASQFIPVTNKIIKADKKIDSQLSLLNIKKTIILTEEQRLLHERKKLREEIQNLCESKDNPPKKRRRSYSSGSEEPKEKSRERSKSRPTRKRKRCSSFNKDTGHDQRERSSCEHRDSCSHEPREKSLRYPKDNSHDIRDRFPHDLKNTHVHGICTRRPRDKYSREHRDKFSGDNTARCSYKQVASSSHHESFHWSKKNDWSQKECRSRYTSNYRNTREKNSRGRQVRDRDYHSWSKQRYENYKRVPNHYSVEKAIDYRPNIQTYNTEKHKPQSMNKDELHKETIIVDKKRRSNKQLGKLVHSEAKREKIKTIREEAIKDILLDLKKQFNGLCRKYKVSDSEKSSLLMKLFKIVDERIKTLKLMNAVTVSNLIMHYRYKYSKIEDNTLVTHLFDYFIATRNEGTELTSTSSNTDRISRALDSVLRDFEFNLLIEDEQAATEIVTPEKEMSNIILKPISSNNPNITKERYIVDENNYYINITIDNKRRNKFFITTKVLLRKMRAYMNKNAAYVEPKLLEYVTRRILEKQIEEILKGKSYLKARELIDLYRQFYPEEGDEKFILQIVYEIWEGKHNDPPTDKTDRPSEIHLDNVKEDICNKEAEKTTPDKEIPVVKETISQNTPETGIKKENVSDVKKDDDKEGIIKEKAKAMSDGNSNETTNVKFTDHNSCETNNGSKEVAMTNKVQKLSVSEHEEIKPKTEENDDEDDVIFVEASKSNDVPNEGSVNSENEISVGAPAARNDDVVIVETKIEVIDLSDSGSVKSENEISVGDARNDDVVIVETKIEVIDLSDSDETWNIETEFQEPKGKIKEEKYTDNNVIDLTDDDVLQINVSNESELDDANDNRTRGVPTEVSVDLMSTNETTTKIKCNAVDLQDTETNELNNIDNEFTPNNEISEVIDNERPDTDANTNINDIVSSHASQRSLNNDIVTTIKESTDNIDGKDGNVKKHVDLSEDSDHNSSVETLVLGEQSAEDIIDISENAITEPKMSRNNVENGAESSEDRNTEVTIKITNLSLKILNISDTKSDQHIVTPNKNSSNRSETDDKIGNERDN